jgi:putative peptidoglycan lipid II flippase
LSKNLKNIGIFFFISLFSKVFGFLREMVTAYFFGTSKLLDAFLVASILPMLLFDGIGAALATGIIPLLSKPKFSERSNRNKFISSLIIWVTALLIALSIVFIVLTPFLVRVVAPSFDMDLTNTVIVFTKYMMPIIIFSGISYIFMSMLQYEGFYNGASIIGFSTSLSIILSVTLLYHVLGIYSLIVGTIVGSIVQIIVFIPFLKKYKYRFVWNSAWTEDHRALVNISLPVLLTSLFSQINITVDRIFASGLQPGSISALNYGIKVNMLIIGTTIMAISSIVFPLFSKLWAEKKKELFFESVSASVSQLTLVMLPLCSMMSILSRPIIKVLFERGAFDSSATNLTATAFSCSIFILVGLSIREILNKALYSMQDSKGPFIGTIVLVISNILFEILLVPMFGISGLTLATAIANIFALPGMFIWFRMRHNVNLISGLYRVISKCVGSTLITSGVVWMLNRYLIQIDDNNIVVMMEVFIIMLVGIGINILMNIILKESHTFELVNKTRILLERKRVY